MNTDNNANEASAHRRTQISADDLHEEPSVNCKLAIARAKELGGETIVNYVPTHNSIILRGDSKIKISDLLKNDIKEVFKSALGFKFTVVGFGPEVKGLKIGDLIDIKNTEGLSLRPFIPSSKNIKVLREKYKNDRDTLIRYGIKSAEDPKHVGVGAAMNIVKQSPFSDKNPFLSTQEEEVDVIEYFATEDYNVSAILFI